MKPVSTSFFLKKYIFYKKKKKGKENALRLIANF